MKNWSIRNMLTGNESMRNIAFATKQYPLSFIIKHYELNKLVEYWKFKNEFKQMWVYRNTNHFDAFQVGAQLALTEFGNERFLLKSDEAVKWLQDAGFIEIHDIIKLHLLQDDMADFTTYLHPELNIVIRVVLSETLANILFAKKVVSTTKEQDVSRRRAVFMAVVTELCQAQHNDKTVKQLS